MARPFSAAAAVTAAQPDSTSAGTVNDGSQPSPSRPVRRSSDGEVPPSHTSIGCWTGRGRRVTPSTRKCSPSWWTSSSVHSRRISPRASSNRPARAPRSTPNARCSAGTGAPSPTAGSRRPPDSRSRLASSLATTTGLRPGSTRTLVPSLSRRVRPAATASAISGSGPGPVSRSLSHSESKPLASSASTKPGKRSASPVSVCVPSPRPMRIFTTAAG